MRNRKDTFANSLSGKIRRDTRRQARAAKRAFAFMAGA